MHETKQQHRQLTGKIIRENLGIQLLHLRKESQEKAFQIQLDNSLGEPLCAILQFSLTYTSSCTRIVQLLQQICLEGPQPRAILKNSPPK